MRLPHFVVPLMLTLAVSLMAPVGQSQLYVYALNSQGKVNVNGVEITDLSGGIKLQSIDELSDLSSSSVVWNSMAIDGADWWVFRTDGKLNNSGIQEDNFNFSSIFDALWIDFTILDGSQWALRSDGRLNVDGTSPVTFSDGSYIFTRIVNDGTDAWSLRSDGLVFRNAETPALFRFDAPNTFGENDGDSIVTEWDSITVDPINGDLYGMRRDGRIAVADPGSFRLGAEGDPPTVSSTIALPFPGDSDNVDVGDAYQQLEFLANGSWLALRADGKVYAEADTANPLVDLPGDPDDVNDNSVYVSLVTQAGEFFSMRQDGQVYVGTDTEAVLDLPGNSYRELAVGNELPNLTNVKTQSPVVTKYTVKAVTGEGFVMPVLISDVDTPSEDVTVTADMTTVPAGAVYDDVARTLTWDNPGPAGKYTFKMTADDGTNKVVNQSFKITVSDPSTNPDKNTKPLTSKIKKADPIDNAAYELPILVADKDMDTLTITVDDTVYPYTAGATFDAMTNTFMWTPVLEDVGKVKLQFDVSDGTVTKKVKVSLKVVASLTTFP